MDSKEPISESTVRDVVESKLAGFVLPGFGQAFLVGKRG